MFHIPYFLYVSNLSPTNFTKVLKEPNYTPKLLVISQSKITCNSWSFPHFLHITGNSHENRTFSWQRSAGMIFKVKRRYGYHSRSLVVRPNLSYCLSYCTSNDLWRPEDRKFESNRMGLEIVWYTGIRLDCPQNLSVTCTEFWKRCFQFFRFKSEIRLRTNSDSWKVLLTWVDICSRLFSLLWKYTLHSARALVCRTLT